MNLGNGGVFGFTWFDRGLAAARAPGREPWPAISGLAMPKVHFLVLPSLTGPDPPGESVRMVLLGLTAGWWQRAHRVGRPGLQPAGWMGQRFMFWFYLVLPGFTQERVGGAFIPRIVYAYGVVHHGDSSIAHNVTL